VEGRGDITFMVGSTTYPSRTSYWCATDIYVGGAPQPVRHGYTCHLFQRMGPLNPWRMEVWCATDICHMRGALPFYAPRMWGPDTPGDSARWGPHMCGAPLVWCATHKAGPVAHIFGCTTATYPWSTETWCAVDNGPMDKGFPSSEVI
jgi:hypothetical protein